MPRTVIASVLAALSMSAFPADIELPCFGQVKVVDSVDCTKAGHGFDILPYYEYGGANGQIDKNDPKFLALPALPSKVVRGACGDPEVVLREIDCTKYGKGKYYALVHTGMKAKSGVKVKFLAGAPSVVHIVSGKTVKLKNGVLELRTVRPWQLVSFRQE